jgi:hypothetical protein
MALKPHNPIDWPTKHAKYEALDRDALMKKIEKRTARKKFWYGVLRAVERFETFHDHEDDIPFQVQKEFGHHVAKLMEMERIFNKEI